jgi:hypothetical protein
VAHARDVHALHQRGEDLAGLPAFFPASSGFGNLGRTRIEVGKPITQLVGFALLEDGTRSATLKASSATRRRTSAWASSTTSATRRSM